RIRNKAIALLSHRRAEPARGERLLALEDTLAIVSQPLELEKLSVAMPPRDVLEAFHACPRRRPGRWRGKEPASPLARTGKPAGFNRSARFTAYRERTIAAPALCRIIGTQGLGFGFMAAEQDDLPPLDACSLQRLRHGEK